MSSPLVLAVALYAALRLAGAAALLRRTPPARARWVALGMLLALNPWPLALVSAHLLGWPGRPWLEGAHPQLIDHLLVYPFWWGFVLALELAPWLLALSWPAWARGWLTPKRRRRLAWIRLDAGRGARPPRGGRMSVDTQRIQLVDETVAVRESPPTSTG